jgi:CheY-like chemotaxis protein
VLAIVGSADEREQQGPGTSASVLDDFPPPANESGISLVGSSIVRGQKLCPGCFHLTSFSFRNCPRCGTPLPERPEADARPLRILLVEDSPTEAAFAQAVICQCDFPSEVHVASDGEEALQFLRREGTYAQAPRPDVILLDLNLPKIDGWQVLNEIRWEPELNAIPVAIVTGSIAEEDCMRAEGLRCEHYVTKPLKTGHVLEIVRAINA